MKNIILAIFFVAYSIFNITQTYAIEHQVNPHDSKVFGCATRLGKFIEFLQKTLSPNRDNELDLISSIIGRKSHHHDYFLNVLKSAKKRGMKLKNVYELTHWFFNKTKKIETIKKRRNMENIFLNNISQLIEDSSKFTPRLHTDQRFKFFMQETLAPITSTEIYSQIFTILKNHFSHETSLEILSDNPLLAFLPPETLDHFIQEKMRTTSNDQSILITYLSASSIITIGL